VTTPRAIWKGTLQLSLVAVPIKVYPATEASATISFHQLHSVCQSRIQQKKWCTTCASVTRGHGEVPAADIVKGYEFEAGKYVVLLADELDAVAPDSTRVIDLTQFAPASALPWRAIDRAYFLVPDGPDGGPAQDAYAVLVDAIAGSVGIGTLAIYGREYLVAVASGDRCLVLYTLHHAAEWRTAPYVADRRALVSAALRGATVAATLVVEALTAPLQLDQFTDTYQADLRRLIDAKIAGQEIVQPAVVETGRPLPILEALTQSLALVAGKTPQVKARRRSSTALPAATASRKKAG
jgi:DNA end-binding protein Ku